MRNISFEERHTQIDYKKAASDYEKAFGYVVPSEYLEFLEESGSGVFPSPSIFEGMFSIDTFYAFDPNAEEGVFSETKSFILNQRITPNIMVFGSTSDCHSTFALILTGNLIGAVVLINDDNLILSDNYSENDLAFGDIIAPSFSAFLDKLEHA